MYSDAIPLPTNVKWRRLFAIALYLALLYFFRKLAPVLICGVVLTRSLGWLADWVDRKTPLHRKGSIAVVVSTLCGLIGVGLFLGIRRLLPSITALRRHGPERLKGILDHPTIEHLRAVTGLSGEKLSAIVRDHAGTAIGYVTGTAHVLLFVLLGFVLAVIYLFERDEVDGWIKKLPAQSLHGTLVRWLGYLGDAVLVTVRMQLVVAVVNALITLPILVIMGLPHIALLSVLILVCGLLPVVGNFISGAVLCVVAYTAHGPWGVVAFLVVTFVLHKIESYYLNPKLAAEHVKWPGLMLVVSLLLFEQAFGFFGLFLSFPTLYVASRMVTEWRSETPAPAAAQPAPIRPRPPKGKKRASA